MIVPKERRPKFSNVRLGFVVDQCFARVPGGTARYTRELGAALAATAAERDSVEGWSAWHQDLEAGVIEGVGGPHRMGLPRVALARAWAAGSGPTPRGVDVVHAPTLFAPPRRGRPLVVTIHDAVPWTHPETLTPHGVHWHQRMGARAAKADVVVVPTHAVAEELGDHLTLRRIEVVGEGVSAAATNLPRDARERLARMGLTPGSYALMIGTAEPRKGFDVALEAWAGSAAPSAPLVIVGPTGWGGVELTHETEARGLGDDRVRLMGRLADEDLATVLASAGVLLAPSRAEGFGLPVLEAMSVGTPVVVSDAPALVEVAGGAGAVVPIGDAEALAAAARTMLEDPHTSEQARLAGRARSLEFSWESAATRLWAIYHALVA